MNKPQNLEEAVKILYNELSLESRTVINAISMGQFTSQAHSSMGRLLRNEWELNYNEQPICLWFTSLGVTHADDRSNIILECLYHKIKGQSYDLKTAITNVKAHWEQEGYKDGIYAIQVRGKYGS